MIHEIVKAALLIFLAELGDKTQLLAMTFVLRFSIGQVLLGVASGTFFSHGLAVLLGTCLAQVVPLAAVRLTSAFLFVCFGLWSLFYVPAVQRKEKTVRGSPILVVAFVFFLGELGDKTQLTAIALASGARFPWAILVGTVLGMVLTSLVAILAGIKLGERISESVLKLISGGVFIAFGFFQLYKAVPLQYSQAAGIGLFIAALIILIFVLIKPPLHRQKTGPGDLRRVASTLQALDAALADLCPAQENCRGERCPVGYCKKLVKNVISGNGIGSPGRLPAAQPYLRREQHFDQAKVRRILTILENGGLNSAIYKDLKKNIEKLTVQRP